MAFRPVFGCARPISFGNRLIVYFKIEIRMKSMQENFNAVSRYKRA